MTDLSPQATAEAIILSDALTMIATGETYDATKDVLLNGWPACSVEYIADICADALREALASGVDREDIDPSWLA